VAVDFGELWVRLAGVMTKCYLLVLRLSYSGKAVHKVFASSGQVWGARSLPAL
jgi:hypothetical protein